MTDQEIIAELGFSDADDGYKQRILDAAHTTVELRMMTVLDKLMDEDKADEFHRIKQEQGNNAAWDYLNAMLETDVDNLYQATMKDYVEQQKQKIEALKQRL